LCGANVRRESRAFNVNAIFDLNGAVITCPEESTTDAAFRSVRSEYD
jgi:hypothetical protein